MFAKYPITSHIMRTRKRTNSLWSLALVGVVTMYAGIYPFIEDFDMESMLAGMPEAMIEALGYDQIGSAAGYISSAVFGLLGPILMLVFAIGLGSRLIAGNEEDGTLELELSSPASRPRIYLQRYEALVLNLTTLIFVMFLSLLAINALTDLGIQWSNIAWMCVALWLFSLALGSVSFAIGAVTGRRVIALGIAAGIAFIAFIFDAVGSSLDQDWMSIISPWSWYIKDSPLLYDPNFGSMGLLVLLAVVATSSGLYFFNKRDLMV